MDQFEILIIAIIYVFVMIVSCFIAPLIAVIMGIGVAVLGLYLIIKSAYNNRNVNEW